MSLRLPHRPRLWWPALVVFCLGLAACDSAPGIRPVGQRAPVLSGFGLTPTDVSSDGLPAGWTMEDGTATGPITVSANASDPDGNVAGVFYVVQSPYDNTQPLAQGPLEATGGAGYAATFPVSIPAGAVGNYTVLVYAVDDDGLLSGETRGLLRFGGTGQPPVIDAVEADPNPLTPPATLRLIATASDPDGLENISAVRVTTPNGQTFSLFDDGASQGDAVADDGRFTAAFDVPAGVAPGTQTFSFQAFDRSGLSSEVVTLDVTVQ